MQEYHLSVLMEKLLLHGHRRPVQGRRDGHGPEARAAAARTVIALKPGPCMVIALYPGPCYRLSLAIGRKPVERQMSGCARRSDVETTSLRNCKMTFHELDLWHRRRWTSGIAVVELCANMCGLPTRVMIMSGPYVPYSPPSL